MSRGREERKKGDVMTAGVKGPLGYCEMLRLINSGSEEGSRCQNKYRSEVTWILWLNI